MCNGGGGGVTAGVCWVCTRACAPMLSLAAAPVLSPPKGVTPTHTALTPALRGGSPPPQPSVSLLADTRARSSSDALRRTPPQKPPLTPLHRLGTTTSALGTPACRHHQHHRPLQAAPRARPGGQGGRPPSPPTCTLALNPDRAQRVGAVQKTGQRQGAGRQALALLC